MVTKCPNHLSLKDIKHYTRAYVKVDRLESRKIVKVCGLRIHSRYEAQFQKGSRYGEIAVDGKVLRINLVPNSLNLKIAPELTTRFPKRTRMYNNDSLNKSILKQNKENECNTPTKTVSFNNTFYITPISPRHNEKSPAPMKDYELAYKEYLKSVQMNGARSTPEKVATPVASPAVVVLPPPPVPPATPPVALPTVTPKPVTDEAATTEDTDDFNDEDMEVEYLEEPKKRRGRPPRDPALNKPPPVFRSSDSPPKKRGWPLGLSRRAYNMQKRGRSAKVYSPVYSARIQSGSPKKRGRPRKIVAFGFQKIVSDIKTVTLPSDLWSAHVSVTAKKSQVCFTRVVQALSNTVPVECDRSVKFNGSVSYLVRINNRDVELLAAPPTVNSLRDVEILLDIVNEIGINDPVLEYHNR